MKNNRLLNIFLSVLSLSWALQTQAQDTTDTTEGESRPVTSVLFERDRDNGNDEPRHDRGHDPSENGRGPNSPRPSNPPPRENNEPAHDRGHDPSENGRGPNSPTPHNTPPRHDPPRPHNPPPRDHDEPVHDRGHDPSENGRGPNSPPPAWPNDPYPSYPEPTPYYPEPTPIYPEPSYPEPTPIYPEPSYPEPIYPAPSYPEPTPVTPAPGPNFQTRTISIPVGRLVSNESIDLTVLARLFNFKNWQVVNIRAVTKPKGTTAATAYLLADDQVIALQKNVGRKINLIPEVQTMMDGSFRTLKLHIKGSTTIIDTIEIEMGTDFN